MEKNQLGLDEIVKNKYRTQRVFFGIAVLYLTLFLSHAIYLKKTVYGDGLYYFAWLRSVVVDQEINFTNDYQLLGISAPTTSLNIPGNKYAIGPAFLWLPGYLWTHLFFRGQGIEWPYQLAVGLQSVGFTLIGCYFLYALLRKYFSQSIALLSILFLAFTTNLLFYGAVDVVNSHSLSFFAAALFINILKLPRPYGRGIFNCASSELKSAEAGSPLSRRTLRSASRDLTIGEFRVGGLSRQSKSWLLLGIVLGLSGLIRLQDTVIGLLLIPFFRIRAVIPILLGFTGIFIWQLFAWHSLYNTWFTSPYILGGESFNWAQPQILSVLFNSKNGLLLWTPSIIFGFIGLFHLPASLSKLSKLFFLIILIQTYLIASWSTWWQGASYSGRMFVSLLPIFTIGFAGMLNVLKTKFHFSKIQFLILLAIFSLFNISGIIYFLLRT